MNSSYPNMPSTQPSFSQIPTPAPLKMPAIFARHETFHPRFGWLKKGFDKANEDRTLFTNDEAPVILGVGKNMVKAIRYWCRAFKILEESPGNSLVPSPFGRQLLGDGGWDPYLEDLASLWLLHWYLLKHPCSATAWELIFNQFHRIEFTPEDLTDFLKTSIPERFPATRIRESSLRKDVNCLLRMYIPQTHSKQINEETLDCPFAELSLLLPSGSSKHCTFNVGSKAGLVPEMIVFACLEFAAMVHDAHSIAISRLMYDPGSPGMIFKLTESLLYDAIECISQSVPEITLSDTAGLVQLSFSEQPNQLALELLNAYYLESEN